MVDKGAVAVAAGIVVAGVAAALVLRKVVGAGALAVSAAANPMKVAVNQTVAFMASASGGTPPYTYLWNLGDGSPLASGATVNHIFLVAGTYAVLVTVADAVGNVSTATVNVTVTGSGANLKVLLSPTTTGFIADVSGGTSLGGGSYDVIGPLGGSSTGFFTFDALGSYSFLVSSFDGSGTYIVSIRDSTSGQVTSAQITV